MPERNGAVDDGFAIQLHRFVVDVEDLGRRFGFGKTSDIQRLDSLGKEEDEEEEFVSMG